MALGELFSKRTKMYVYRQGDEETKQVLTAENTKTVAVLI